MSLRKIVFFLLLSHTFAQTGIAQGDDVYPTVQIDTRASLEVAADEAEAQARRATNAEARTMLQARARMLRDRLEIGDLRVGDKIAIEGVNLPDPALSDTFTVRTGQMLRLPGIGTEIPLRGVLRFELTDHITRYLSADIINPQLRTTTMLGIFLTGQVAAPGAKSVTPDALLRDVVTPAGLLTSLADIDKITIRRQGEILYPRDSVRSALTQGRTLEDLQILSGDEIEVGTKRQANPYVIVQVATGALGLILGLYNLIR
jgi:hypothetical protein